MAIYLGTMLPRCSSEGFKHETKPSLLAASWVYIATKVTFDTGGLLLPPFTITFKADFSLLHFPSGCPGHLLDGTLFHSSSDFPLEIQATTSYAKIDYIINPHSYKRVLAVHLNFSNYPLFYKKSP